MSTAVVRVPTQPSVPVPAAGDWNTLQILKASRAVILALTALLAIAVVVGTGVHRDAMKVIGKDTAPSIIAAEHIKAALADMDANAANELLTDAQATSSTGQPVDQRGAQPLRLGQIVHATRSAGQLFDERRVEASEALISAAQNITYGAREKDPIEVLQVSAGTYERLIQQARDQQEAHQPEGAMRFYRSAASLMDRTLLPAADQLDEVNSEMLGTTYDRETEHSRAWRGLMTACGLLTVGALVWVQLFLSRRMHRTLNPLLAVATLATVWLVLHSFTAMGNEERQLKIARKNAFTSIDSLWRARADAYAANAVESRYLLDPAHTADYQAAYLAKTYSVAHIPQTAPVDDVIASAQRGAAIPGFTGYLANELNNITFAGERDAAVRALAAWEQYMAVDAEIRRLEVSGQHQKAIELCLGTAKGQSDWAFDQFDQALRETLDINQRAFDAAVGEGFDAVKSLELEAAVTGVLIAVLVFFGFKGRIREYD